LIVSKNKGSEFGVNKRVRKAGTKFKKGLSIPYLDRNERRMGTKGDGKRGFKCEQR